MPLKDVDLKRLHDNSVKVYTHTGSLSEQELDKLIPALAANKTLEGCILSTAGLGSMKVPLVEKLLMTFPTSLMKLDLSGDQFSRDYETIFIRFIQTHPKLIAFLYGSTFLKGLSKERIDQAIKENQARLEASELEQKRLLEKLNTYTEMLRKTPNDAATLHNKGNLLYDLGRLNEALEDFNHALRLEPNNAAILMDRGVVLGKLGRHNEALTDFNRSLELRPNHAVTLYNRGLALYNLGRYSDAITDYDLALKIAPDFTLARIHREKAVSALAEKNKGIPLAPTAVSEVMVSSKGDSKAQAEEAALEHYNRGVALSDLGHHDEALTAYNRSLKLRPNHANTLNNRGLVLSVLGRYSEALTDYNRSLELRPNDAVTLTGRGAALHALGRHSEALTDFNRSLELRPNDAVTLTGRGAALHTLGRHSEALTDFNRSLELRPNAAVTLTGRGAALYHLGRFSEALTDFNRSLELQPNDAATLHNRGLVLSVLGRYSEALTDFNRSLELRPNDAVMLNNRGNALHALGRFSEAITDYDLALKIKPDYTKARNNREKALSALAEKSKGIPSKAPTAVSEDTVSSKGDSKAQAEEVALDVTLPERVPLPDLEELERLSQKNQQVLRETEAALERLRQHQGLNLVTKEQETLETVLRQAKQEAQDLQEKRWILQSDARADYYYTFQLQFNGLFLACQTIHSQMVANESSTHWDTVAKGLKKASSHIPIAGIVLDVLASGLAFLGTREKREIVNRGARFFPGAMSCERIGELLARQLTLQLQGTLSQLATGPKLGFAKRQIQKLKDLKNQLLVNDIDTAIRELADNHCKKFITAVFQAQIKPDPQSSELLTLIRVILPGANLISLPTAVVAPSQSGAVVATPLTPAGSRNTVDHSSLRTEVESLRLQLERDRKERAAERETFEREKKAQAEEWEREQQERRAQATLLEQQRYALERAQRELADLNKRVSPTEASGNGDQALALERPVSAKSPISSEVTDILTQHDVQLRWMMDKMLTLPEIASHSNTEVSLSSDKETTALRQQLFNRDHRLGTKIVIKN